MLRENFRQVEENIRRACGRAGRDPGDVTLIAVSKTKPVELLREAYDLGTRVFGENKVQEIVEKYEALNRQCGLKQYIEEQGQIYHRQGGPHPLGGLSAARGDHREGGSQA